jgi:cytochrome c oxidase subunit 4
VTEHATEVTPVRSYALVLIALLVLTGLTAGVSFLHLKHGSLVVALLIAAAKASLVIAVFMHLAKDARALRAVLALALFLAGVFFALSALDWSPRDGDFEHLPAQSSIALHARGLR